MVVQVTSGLFYCVECVNAIAGQFCFLGCHVRVGNPQDMGERGAANVVYFPARLG